MVIAALLAMLVGLPLLVRWVGLPFDVPLKLAALIFAWPVAATILGFVFFARFHSAIDYVIRYGRFTLPGGAELQGQAPQPEEPAEKATVEDGSMVLSPDRKKQLQEFIEALAQKQQLTFTEKQNFERLYQEALQRAVYWEFRYLDAFLVPTTKNVLHWLAGLTPAGGVTRQQFHATWATIVKDEVQRQIIIRRASGYRTHRRQSRRPKGHSKGLFISSIHWLRALPVTELNERLGNPRLSRLLVDLQSSARDIGERSRSCRSVTLTAPGA